MALTRTEDKTDKAIARLLLQSPLGLTIGDITAAAKCTPQTARKSLARIGAEKDASGMLYVLRDDEQPEKAAQAEPEAEPTAPTQQPETMLENWGGITFLNPFADAHAPEPTDPAPAAVAEAPAAQPERTHAETTIRQFKPGDYVVPINTHVIYTAKMKRHLGRVLQVSVVRDGYYLSVRAGIPGEEAWWRWHPDDLRPATAKEIAAAQKLKPLRRGDLVMHRGQIGVVYELDPDGEDGYWVAMLTGDASCVCRGAEDLTRIGSIRKKVKRLKAAIAKAGGES